LFTTTTRLLRSLSVAVLLLSASAEAAQPRIWFVDNSRSGGDGSFAAPFRTIGAATSAADAGDVIYVFRGSGAYRESVVLKERQLLAGHGSDIARRLSERGISAAAELPTLPAEPTIDGGDADALVIAGGAVVAGLKLRSTSGRALVAMNVAGEASVDRVTIETTSGTAVAIDGGDANIHIIRSPVIAARGSAVIVRNRVGGTIEFRDGSTVTVNAGARDGVLLENNKGDITFGDALRVTTAGARALAVRSSQRVTMSSGDSVLTTTGAPAIEIAGSGIAIHLHSVNVDGAGASVARGVSVENATGTFRIDGGAIRNVASRGISIANAGAVILQNLTLEKIASDAKATPACSNLSEEKDPDCSAAIHLVDATNVVLKQVRIDDSGQIGIFGDRVAELSLDAVTITDSGDEMGEHGLALRDLRGRAVIYDSEVKDSASRQLFIVQREGEASLEIRKSRFDGAPAPNGQQGIAVHVSGEAKMSIVVDDSTFTEHYSDALHFIAEGSSRLEAIVNGSRFAGMASAINLASAGDAQVQYRFTGNGIRGATAAAINVNTAVKSASANGTISGNTIGVNGVASSGARCGGCSGISVLATRGGTIETIIRDNTVQRIDGYGIRVNARGTASMRAVVTGNTIREPDGTGVLNAIAVQSGSLSADTARICVDLSANTISGAWDPQGDGSVIALAARGNASIGIIGDIAAGATSVVRERNHGATVKAAGTAAIKSCP
jgi:hypothetical protein